MSERELFKALGLREDVIVRINHYADGGPFDDIDGASPVQMREFLTKFGAESDLADISEASVSRTKYRPKTSKSDRVRAARERKRNVAAKQKAKRAAKNPTEKRKRRKRMKMKAKKAGGYTAMRQQQKKGFRFQVASMGVPALDSIHEEVVNEAVTVKGTPQTVYTPVARAMSEPVDRIFKSFSPKDRKEFARRVYDMAQDFQAVRHNSGYVSKEWAHFLPDIAADYGVDIDVDDAWKLTSLILYPVWDADVMDPADGYEYAKSIWLELRRDVPTTAKDLEKTVMKAGQFLYDWNKERYGEATEESVTSKAVVLACDLADGFESMAERLDEVAERLDGQDWSGEVSEDAAESLARDVAEVARIFGMINLEETCGKGHDDDDDDDELSERKISKAATARGFAEKLTRMWLEKGDSHLLKKLAGAYKFQRELAALIQKHLPDTMGESEVEAN